MADVGIPTADGQHAERVTFLLIEDSTGEVVIGSADFNRLTAWIEKRSFGRVASGDWVRHGQGMWCPVAKWYSRVWFSHPCSVNLICEVEAL